MSSGSGTPIRAIEGADRSAVLEIARTSGLFSDGELSEVASMVDAFLSGALEEGHRWIAHAAPKLDGVAYFAPEGFSDGVWNLYMLAVDPGTHGQGVGAALVDEVITNVRASGGRILLVETSGIARFERTRRFYEMCGFVREATIRDYYGPGDHKVVYWKSIAP